ncbi:hypothetical protein BD324DRAFT_634014 [Kockovaella imperatae]|uniref:Uncharacterized protein n=1 Tax=Kockovaella imperatae TaxID=4999 RepID=A0A1Y1UCB2_9TREE|nr:hypothetical protein BD324DRAFT_634014 [Kockovaella imperatae]ORX35136.1 hypothetical protein BD324DRAFT_634014 [Kockovaella imperatae]
MTLSSETDANPGDLSHDTDPFSKSQPYDEEMKDLQRLFPDLQNNTSDLNPSELTWDNDLPAFDQPDTHTDVESAMLAALGSSFTGGTSMTVSSELNEGEQAVSAGYRSAVEGSSGHSYGNQWRQSLTDPDTSIPYTGSEEETSWLGSSPVGQHVQTPSTHVYMTESADKTATVDPKAISFDKDSDSEMSDDGSVDYWDQESLADEPVSRCLGLPVDRFLALSSLVPGMRQR